MSSIFRFYKFNAENIEALKGQYIYLFSAKKWEYDGEFDFEIDIGSDEEYKLFIDEFLNSYYQLKSTDLGFIRFRNLVLEKLNANGKIIFWEMPNEYSILSEILFQEAKSTNGNETRKNLIKNLFFDTTGISCFTADSLALENFLHWESFSNYGNGFCVEYDKDLLEKYFSDNACFIVIDSIKYYKTNKPILKHSHDLEIKANVYQSIFFSLKQALKDEMEVRMSKIFKFNLNEHDERRKQYIPINAIKSITLGYNLSKQNEENLLQLINKEFNNTNIFRVTDQFGVLIKSNFCHIL